MKLLVTCLISASLVIGTQVIATAAPKDYTRWRGPCDGTINGEDDTSHTALGIRQWHTKHLVRCIFDLFAPAQTAMALVVGERESHFFPDAYNPSGCAGVFQHQSSLWTGRTILMPRRWLAPYLWTRWRYGDGPATASPFNPYVNVIVTAVMTSTGNWGPWS